MGFRMKPRRDVPPRHHRATSSAAEPVFAPRPLASVESCRPCPCYGVATARPHLSAHPRGRGDPAFAPVKGGAILQRLGSRVRGNERKMLPLRGHKPISRDVFI